MKMRALRTLIFLANNGCDFGGHKLLGIPRSTMWAHISEIEAETGLKLVFRKKQHASFTEAGRAFIPYAQEMYQAFEEAIDQITNPDEGGVRGQIIISTTPAVATGWLMPSIKEFHFKYPDLRVHIVANDYLSKKTEVSSDVLLRPVRDIDGFTKIWGINYHHGLFASEEYLERMGVPKKPEDLKNHCILGYGEHEFSYFEDVNWHLKGRGYKLPKLTPILTINSTTSLYRAALEGMGICSAPVESEDFYRRTVTLDISGKLVRVLPEINGPKTSTYFCIKQNISDSAKRNANIFQNFFLEQLEKMGVRIYHEKTNKE